MKNNFQIKTFVIVAFFLAAYLNVIAKQASCNLPYIFQQNSKPAHHHNNDNEGTDSHHHDDQSSHKKEEKSKKDDNCCNDKTTAFFESQGNPVISSFDFKNISYSELAFINVLFIYNQSVFSAKGYVFYSLPPPKISDIRVFIRSFII